MARLAILITVAFASTFAFDRCLADEPIVLWKSLTVGMTVADVGRLVPDAKPKLHRDVTRDGWVSLLTERERSSDHDRQVEFQFEKNRLMGVTVVEGERFGLSAIGQSDVGAVIAELRQTYGTPIRCQDQKGGGQACFWLKEGKFIGYLGLAQPSSYAMIFLSKELPRDRNLLK